MRASTRTSRSSIVSYSFTSSRASSAFRRLSASRSTGAAWRPVSFHADVAVEIERALHAVGRRQLDRQVAPGEIVERVLRLAGIEEVRHQRGVVRERPEIEPRRDRARAPWRRGRRSGGSDRARPALRALREPSGCAEKLGVYIGDDAVDRDREPEQRAQPRARRPTGSIGVHAPALLRACWKISTAASASRTVRTSTSKPAARSVRRRSRCRRRVHRGCAGSRVRNSSWLNSARTRSRSKAPRSKSLGRRPRAATSRRRIDISRFFITRSCASPRFWRCFGGRSSRCSKIPSRFVGGDEQRGLLADARDAGKVVARVAAQRGVLEVLRGRHPAAAIRDAGLVVERVVGDAALVVEHLDVRVGDELERIAVAGDDHDVDSGRGRLRRQRRDHVVGLDAGPSIVANRERRRAPRGSAAAATRTGRASPATRPCTRSPCLCERCGPRRVERDGDLLRLLVGQHLHQHRREAVDGVGDGARLGREVGRERVERPVRQRMAVEQEQLAGSCAGLRRRRHGADACRRSRRARPARSCAASPSRPFAGTATSRPSLIECSSMSRPFARSMFFRASSRSARSAFSFSSATICSKRPERHLDRRQELARLERLDQIRQRARIARLLDEVVLRERGEDQDRGETLGRDRRRRGETVHPRHLDVEDREVGIELAHEVDRVIAAAGLTDDFVALFLEGLLQVEADDGLVFGDDDTDRAWSLRGNLSVSRGWGGTRMTGQARTAARRPCGRAGHPARARARRCGHGPAHPAGDRGHRHGGGSRGPRRPRAASRRPAPAAERRRPPLP